MKSIIAALALAALSSASKARADTIIPPPLLPSCTAPLLWHTTRCECPDGSDPAFSGYGTAICPGVTAPTCTAPLVPLNGACSCPLGTVPAPGGGPITECLPPDAPPPVPRLCVVSLTYLVNLPTGGGLNPIVARDPAAECADDATLDLAIAVAPACSSDDHRVMASKERGSVIRRIRECDHCMKRWTTIEAPEPIYDRAESIVKAFRVMSDTVGEE